MNSTYEEFIPALPSTYLIHFFYQLCDEIQRIGGHMIDDDIIQFINHEISTIMLNAYFDFLTKTDEISKENMLQLWFDIKFFSEMFQSRGQISDELLTIIENLFQMRKVFEKLRDTSDLVAWTKQLHELTKLLKSKLDPIDVLFYEKPILNQTNEYYKSAYLLFGHLTKENPRLSEKFNVNTATSPNILMLLPAVGRFKLLPILESNDGNDVEPTEPVPHITLSENTKEKQPELNPEISGPGYNWWSFFLKKN